jgi:hypothetical protein
MEKEILESAKTYVEMNKDDRDYDFNSLYDDLMQEFKYKKNKQKYFDCISDMHKELKNLFI